MIRDYVSGQMKMEIENAVAKLVGEPLWGCSRAADMACFSFGARVKRKNRHGKEYEVGRLALHVQCGWRIVHGDRIFVGSRDLGYPADYDGESPYHLVPEEFDWDRDPNRRDKLLAAFFEQGTRSLVVERTEVHAGGILFIRLEGGLSLDVFPDVTVIQEHWRLFESGNLEPHFVVTPRGISF